MLIGISLVPGWNHRPDAKQLVAEPLAHNRHAGEIEFYLAEFVQGGGKTLGLGPGNELLASLEEP